MGFSELIETMKKLGEELHELEQRLLEMAAAENPDED